jgi:hypothetical protein
MAQHKDSKRERREFDRMLREQGRVLDPGEHQRERVRLERLRKRYEKQRERRDA